MTDAAIRKEYSKLRSIANKRLARLQAQGLNMTARTGYRFPTIKSVEESSKSTVASELADVSKFLKDEYHSTLKGEKRFINDFQEIMKEKGFSDLVETADEVYQVLDFLDDVREIYKDKLLPSDVLQALQEAERLDIPKDMLYENIEMFVSHLDELKNVKPSKGGAAFSSRRMNNLIEQWNK